MCALPYPSAADAASFPWPDEDKIKAQSDSMAAGASVDYGASQAPYDRQSPYNPSMGGGDQPYVPNMSMEGGFGGYPPQGGGGYPPPPGGGGPPAATGYPPSSGYHQPGGYPSQPAAPGYPPAPAASFAGVPTGYPPAGGGYPPQAASFSGYPPAPGTGYPPAAAGTGPGYPPAAAGTGPGYPPAATGPGGPGYPPAPPAGNQNSAAPGYPPYPPAPPTDQNLNPEVPASADRANLNQGHGKLLDKYKGVTKALDKGLDALNRTGLSSYIPGIPGMGGDAGGGGGYPPPQPDAAPYVPPAAPGYPGGGGGGPGYSMGGGGQFPSFPAPGQPMRNIFNESQVKRFKDQDYESLKRSSQSSGRLFQDQAFPASNSLLVDSNSSTQSIFTYFGGGGISASGIEWLRPNEICRNPQMFVGGLDRFDINQGEIGNCWFLAALANLAENKRCFERVVPPHQGFGPDHVGIFKFRFWRFGEWVEVVIDDRLPTRNGKLIYVRSVEKNEFWSALLEKAYAKLHGSYKALEGGLTIEAAVDFTGGIPELIDLQRTKMSPERLFYIMSRADARGAFMGCALNNTRASEAQRMGLQSRHAYTITKVVEIRSPRVRGGIPLVRIRNPHGNHREWRGEWSDGDRNWQAIPSHMRQELGLTYGDDGEFYMSFRDFLRYFGELELCHLSPDAVEVSDDMKKFEVFHFYGSWRRGSTAGGCGNNGLRSYAMNPQFFINLSDPDPYDDEELCPVIVSLMQRQRKRKSEHAIGFKIYKCDLQDRQLTEQFMRRNNSIDRTDTFINLREVSKRLLLPQGRYCVVPSTFEYGEEGDFMLRLFIEKRWGSSEHGGAQQVTDAMDGGAQQPLPAGGGGGGGYDFNQGMQGLNIGGGGPPPQQPYGGGGDPYGGGGGGGGGDPYRRKKKTNKVIGFAFKQLEKNFPQHAKGIQKLKNFYSWATDAESEFDLLKNIVKSM